MDPRDDKDLNYPVNLNQDPAEWERYFEDEVEDEEEASFHTEGVG